MSDTHTTYDAGEFAGSSYIKKEDLAAGPQRFTIQHVSKVVFEARNGRPESTQLQLDLGDERQFSINKTNVKILMRAFGRKTADWIGRDIALYVDPHVMFGGSLVGGVRVQIPETQQQDLQRDIAEAMPTLTTA